MLFVYLLGILNYNKWKRLNERINFHTNVPEIDYHIEHIIKNNEIFVNLWDCKKVFVLFNLLSNSLWSICRLWLWEFVIRCCPIF